MGHSVRTRLNLMSKLAICGRALTTVGITSAGAILWLRVTLPSLFGQMTIIGELAGDPVEGQGPGGVEGLLVAELGETAADLHMSCTHLQAPVWPQLVFLTKSWSWLLACEHTERKGLTWMWTTRAAPSAMRTRYGHQGRRGPGG